MSITYLELVEGIKEIHLVNDIMKNVKDYMLAKKYKRRFGFYYKKLIKLLELFGDNYSANIKYLIFIYNGSNRKYKVWKYLKNRLINRRVGRNYTFHKEYFIFIDRKSNETKHFNIKEVCYLIKVLKCYNYKIKNLFKIEMKL